MLNIKGSRGSQSVMIAQSEEYDYGERRGEKNIPKNYRYYADICIINNYY